MAKQPYGYTGTWEEKKERKLFSSPYVEGAAGLYTPTVSEISEKRKAYVFDEAKGQLLNLIASGDSSLPTHVTLPDNLSELSFVNYDSHREGQDRKIYTPVRYLYPDEFLRRQNGLNTEGIYDLQEFSRKFKIEYELVADRIEPKLADDEIIVDNAGLIVTSSWIKKMKDYAEEQGALRITSFARDNGLRRSSVIAMARRFLKGAYIPRSDSYLLAEA